MRDKSLQRLVAVFGVSGVGKSTLLRDYVASHPDWIHLIAGDVLSAITRRGSEALRTSGKEDIEANQRKLVERILEISGRHRDKSVLLDAHCVIDGGQELVKVPISAIEELQPDLVVCVWDEPAEIVARRAAATDRARPTRTVAQVDSYQKMVMETCEEYARELGVEWVKLMVGDSGGLDGILACRKAAGPKAGGAGRNLVNPHLSRRT